MNRRRLLQLAAAIPFLPGILRSTLRQASAQAAPQAAARVRPTDAAWPTAARWDELKAQVEGRLIKVTSPLSACQSNNAACAELFKNLKNPYFIGDDPALTQTLGYLDAWTSAPSVYAVAARHTADVVAAVNFAREHRLRVAVKGGGHSYQGTSNAPDSLLIWTRAMNHIEMHDSFVAQGCTGQASQPAVTIGAGAMWGAAYDAVTTRGGRYVQGGGCMSVGVAGLVQSGGFGSFSKNYGLASAALLEAEIVTADGAVRIANACTNADLFWAIKGGGGGSFGVVTKLTLRTRELPATFGVVMGRIKASSDTAFRQLIDQTMQFYAASLLNRHWGEQIIFERQSNAIRVNMLFQGLGQPQAEAAWKPFLDAVKARPEFSIDGQFAIMALPARHLWDPAFLAANAPGTIIKDDRAGTPATNVFWAADRGQAGQFLQGYSSAWLPASLLQDAQRHRLVDAMFESTRHWQFSLHFNKGLAGAPADEIEAARNTAMNPDVLDAFALAIMGGEGPPAFPGIAGHEPDLATARTRAAAIGRAMEALRKAAPNTGSYVSESDFFERDWQRSFWGANYQKLAEVKKKYDGDGLFIVHHGVGSEDWSADGFARVSAR
jgi:FAD/FMN-containing dehydrogenase